VSNDTDVFSFIDEITVADGASFTVSTDINGSNVIRTKTVNLAIGDNTYYILVENGKEIKLYNVFIRRRPIYTVTFDSNGGTEVEPQQIEEDSCAIEPTTERKGYTFDKWDYDFSEPIIRNTTITASWNIITYNVYYDLNVPSDSISQDVDNSMNVTTYTVEVAITFKTPSRKGYRFTGWDTNIKKGTIGDVTVTASWEVIEYSIAYNFGDVDSVSKATNNTQNPSMYTIEDAITFAEPSRDGYTFVTWNKNIVRGTIGTQTIAASWKIIEYDIIYDFGDTDSVSKATNNEQNPSKYTIEDAITFAEPSRKGYTFIAWDRSIASGTIGTQTISASWEVIEYSIAYNFGDANSVSKATNNKQNPSTYTIEDTITFAEPSRDGYTFIAWNKNIVSGTTDAQTISASWEVVNYSITYVLNGWDNSSQNVYTYTIEDGTITLYDAIKGESLFCGWYLDEEYKHCITTIDALTMRDYTVYAYADDSATKGLSIENGSVKGYSGTLTDVVIPSYYKGYNVTSIERYAFGSRLTSITIPDNMTSIDGSAFKNCGQLTTVNWNAIACEKAGSANDPVFSDCSSFTTVNIGSKVTSIPSRAFSFCKQLTNITIPDSLTSIGMFAFSFCSKLKDIYITDVAAWCDISGLSNLMNSGASKKNLFLNKELVTSVKIKDRVKNIPASAFRNFNSLTSIIIPNSVTSIGYYAFYGCIGLTDIAIPDSVKSIGERAFSDSSGLKSVTIGNSVTNIGSYAFYGCSGFTSLTIPDSVTSIGDAAFKGCNGLTSISVGSKNTKYHSFDNCLIETASKKLILGCETSVIPTDGSVTSIGNSAFV